MPKICAVIAFLLFAAPAMAQVTLQWDPYQMACSGFKLYETTTPGVYTTTPIFTITPCTQTTTTFALPSPGTYYYRLTAFDATRESAPSNEVSVVVPMPPLPPPTGLTVGSITVSVGRKDAVLMANTNLPAKITFVAGKAGSSMKPYPVTGTSTHGQVQLARLQPRTTYSYRWTASTDTETVYATGIFTTTR